jgi:hypothetical protein
MHDSEELPDDVPIADAADQQRVVNGPVPDEDAAVEPSSEPPLEASAADWQEQLETIEIDPDEYMDRD